VCGDTSRLHRELRGALCRSRGRRRAVRATARKRPAAATNGAATGVDGFWFGHPLLECRCSGELARLLADPVLRGRGVPHGDGRSVLLLPGFLVSDATLRLLARFLGRIGYRPIASGIRFNSGCGDSFDERMVGVIDREYSMGGRRLAIVGHSRGGHYARSLTARYPDRVLTSSRWAPGWRIHLTSRC
jgi:pimeloyl-ACP methyl ester carboxylesterase